MALDPKTPSQPAEDPLASISYALALDPRDMSENRHDAWLYGIAVGWDEDALKSMAQQHHWTPAAVERLKRLRAVYRQLMSLSEALTRKYDDNAPDPDPLF